MATLLKEVKGAFSHLMTYEAMPGKSFQWQGASGAFTVSREAVDAIADYVRNQKAHQAGKQLIEDLERCEIEG